MNKYDEHITEKEFKDRYEPLGLLELEQELLLYWEEKEVNRMLYDYKELVELRTPKKVKRNLEKYKGYYPQSNYWADCPNCSNTVYNDNETVDNFCPKCGIALDWEV